MAVGALEGKFWALLCATLERPDLVPGHLATGAEGARVRAALAAIFRSRSQQAWVEIFDLVDCCVTPVLRLEESLRDRQLQARAMVVEVDGTRQFGPAVRMSDMPPLPLRAAPLSAGADTEAILDALGIDGETRCRLRAAGVI
jgi:crotonobetainyl-CoA:carnitine CoA-transferase CaiB-like acyl-CoA transferase